MKTKMIAWIAVFLLMGCWGYGQNVQQPNPNILSAFLSFDAVWEGDFQNYVNRNDGMIQNGTIRVEITFGGDTIKMRNSFINQQGVASDYSGYSYMMVSGDSLMSTDISGFDENTGNQITDYKYWGRILDNHIFIHESYKELHPDGKMESRSNSVHYYLKSENEIIQLAEVWLDEKLLVFAGTALRRK